MEPSRGVEQAKQNPEPTALSFSTAWRADSPCQSFEESLELNLILTPSLGYMKHPPPSGTPALRQRPGCLLCRLGPNRAEPITSLKLLFRPFGMPLAREWSDETRYKRGRCVKIGPKSSRDRNFDLGPRSSVYRPNVRNHTPFLRR